MALRFFPEIGSINFLGEAGYCGKGLSWVGEARVLPPSTGPCSKVAKRQVKHNFLGEAEYSEKHKISVQQKSFGN